MRSGTDMRIPVLFGGSPEPDDAVLVEDGQDIPEHGYTLRFALGAPGTAGHVFGCACCTPRGAAADALARLFRARATGAAPYFGRVLVLASPQGEAALRDALAADVLTQARYRS